MRKSIWQEIKEQPPHIREIFMWVCVVAIFSVIGFSWFSSTTKQFALLVNPENAQPNADQLAQNQATPTSPFATISKSWSDLMANIGQLFNFTQKTNDIRIENKNLPEVPPNILPLSGDKK
ncbi:MAG: hypothetical protein ABR875_00585 [Minisyncoccia bacterium]|jgi:cytosine/uracil/thiamine/allantoin permease